MGNFALAMAFQVVRALFASPMMGTLNAVISEATHFTYLKKGVKLEGTMFAVSSMGMKVGLGVGAALCGWLLELGKYDGMAATQPASALSMMTFLFLACPLIIGVVNALVVSKLNVSKAIADMFKNEGNTLPTPSLIINQVCKFYSIEESVLRGTLKNKGTAEARHVAVYLIRQLTNLSLPDIGKELNRDHSTILHSIRKVEVSAKSDERMKETIRDITASINSSV